MRFEILCALERVCNSLAPSLQTSARRSFDVHSYMYITLA